jgi:hypothetical protein
MESGHSSRGEPPNNLREHIHKYGATYSPKELQGKLFGETYTPQYLLNYLEQKFLELTGYSPCCFCSLVSVLDRLSL